MPWEILLHWLPSLNKKLKEKLEKERFKHSLERLLTRDKTERPHRRMGKTVAEYLIINEENGK
jgi:hypothetical protein